MKRAFLLLLKGIFILIPILFVLAYPGSVTLQWESYLIHTTTPVMALGVVLGAFLLYPLTRFILKGRMFPLWLRRWMGAKDKTFVEDSLLSAAVLHTAEDKDNLIKELNRFTHLIDNASLKAYIAFLMTHLQESPEEKASLEKLITFKQGQFLGYCALATQALTEKAYQSALFYLEEAHKSYKKSPWVVKKLVALYLSLNRFKDAERLLRYGERGDVFTWEQVRSIQAEIWLTQAFILSEKARERIELLKKGVEWSPGLSLAVQALATHYFETNKPKKAREIIEEAWNLNPYPPLIELYLSQTQDPLEQAKQVQSLIDKNPQHPISLEKGAVVFLNAGLWGKGKECLEAISKERFSCSIHHLWDRLKKEAPSAIVSSDGFACETKQVSSDKTSPWTCQQCHNHFFSWQAVCSQCLSVGEILYTA